VAHAVNGAYYIRGRTLKERRLQCNAVKKSVIRLLVLRSKAEIEALIKEWRIKLGHFNREKLIAMFSQQLVEGMPYINAATLNQVPFFCQTCAKVKMNRMSYRNIHGSRDESSISTIHMDTNGPMETMGIYGTVFTVRYFLRIVDNHTSSRWSFVLRNKKEVNEKVRELLLQLEREGKFQIRRIRSDGGTEFVNKAFKIFCKERGIVFQTSNA
jgi:hypothetical protein